MSISTTLEATLAPMLDAERPELILYQAGVDPFGGDRLGRLNLTDDGLARRERLVARLAIERGIPLASTVGGGYGDDVIGDRAPPRRGDPDAGTGIRRRVAKNGFHAGVTDLRWPAGAPRIEKPATRRRNSADMATAAHEVTPAEASAHPPAESIVVRFAGDSGDGMQLTGGQFTLSTALAGNDLATFPDFPAEIRAPLGTLFGVSAFQINFGSTAIETAGDALDVLVAMNPAALKTNVDALKLGGLIIADSGEFTERNLAKAKYDANPIEDGSLAKWQVLAFNISQLTLDAVKPFGLGNKEALRCKNMWTLGLALWMFDRDRQPLIDWLKAKFAKNPTLAEANIAAINAGHAYGETAEISGPLKQHHVAAAPAEPGLYRTVTGAEAISMGLVAGAQLAEHADVLRRLSDHAGVGDPAPSEPAQGVRHHHLPGRGRDRRDRQRDRRVLRRAARRHLVVGAGHRAQGRGDGPRDHDRAAAGHHQFAARRAVDRPADQDRAIGPLSGGLWPQRRRADAGDRRAQPVRCVRGRDRGGAHRDAIHDPGDGADRRLYRQRRRAVEGARGQRLRAVPGANSWRQAPADGFQAYARDEKLARPWVKPGTPGPAPPHRRDREGARAPATSTIRPPTTRR